MRRRRRLVRFAIEALLTLMAFVALVTGTVVVALSVVNVLAWGG